MSQVRTSIEIEGVTHGNTPIPMASKIGNLVYSSAIMGKDKETNRLPDDVGKELACLFDNVRAVMEAAGGTPEHIIRMSVYLAGNDLREAFNKEWNKMFPDPHSRPARHITVTELRNGMRAQVEIVAVLA